MLLSSFLTAQINVPQVQKSLYTAYESTGCGYCGLYTIPVTNQIAGQVGGKTVFFSLHQTSSAFYSPKNQVYLARLE